MTGWVTPSAEHFGGARQNPNFILVAESLIDLAQVSARVLADVVRQNVREVVREVVRKVVRQNARKKLVEDRSVNPREAKILTE